MSDQRLAVSLPAKPAYHLWTLAEVALSVPCSVRTLNNEAIRGRLVITKIGRLARIRNADWTKYLERGVKGGSAE